MQFLPTLVRVKKGFETAKGVERAKGFEKNAATPPNVDGATGVEPYVDEANETLLIIATPKAETSPPNMATPKAEASQHGAGSR